MTIEYRKAVLEDAELLIDIHGQHEHQSLLKPRRQLEILDEFCGEESKKEKLMLQQAYRNFKEAQKELESYSLTEEERLRHTVRPGLTGLAQVNGRTNIDCWEDRFRWDLEYVRRCGFRLDCRILCKTAVNVLRRKDVLTGSEIRAGRLDEARGGEGQHYGLGLSIAKAAAEKHGGGIGVSCQDGKVRFTVSIPIKK